MDFLSIKWFWLYAGVILMLLEIASQGFVIFFFGLAAATVGGVLFLYDFSATMQVAIFSLMSIVYLVSLRRSMMSVFMGNTPIASSIENEYVGRIGKVLQAIRPELPGRIMLGDAEWSATAHEAIDAGAEVRVVAQNNLTLAVEKI